MTHAAGAFAAGMGLGAGLMYFLDPDRGGRRRTHARNQLIHASHAVRDNPRAQLLARGILDRVVTRAPRRMPALATALAGVASLAIAARALNGRTPEFELRP